MRRGDRNDPDTDPFSPFYGRRRSDGRQGLADLRMQQGLLRNPRLTPGIGPGGPHGGLNPRNPDPRINLMNPYQRMNPMNGYQRQASPPPMDDVKKWVLETCGGNLEEATGSMKIRDIPGDFPQFVVNRPTMQLQTAFKDRKSRTKSGSRLMFHGTPLPNLQPILQDGFRGSWRGLGGEVWVAREPGLSVFYALKGAMGSRIAGGMVAARAGPMLGERARALEHLAESPYISYGALLGCEYVAPGGNSNRTATSTNDRHAVMVRYVFLIPPSPHIGVLAQFEDRNHRMDQPQFPKRSQINT